MSRSRLGVVAALFVLTSACGPGNQGSQAPTGSTPLGAASFSPTPAASRSASPSVSAAVTAAPTAPPTPRPTATVAAPAVPSLSDTAVQTGLVVPWDLAFSSDGRMFVTERRGTLSVFASGATGAPRLSMMTVPQVAESGEAGLMGIALDPDFARNGLLFVCATRNDGGTQNEILRLRASGNSIAFDAVITKGIRAGGNHDGCRIRFGPDGKLWATMGEAGDPSLAQNPNVLNGKILRLNSDGSVPADNPILPGASARTIAYATGNRNPQGIDFQPGTGTVFEVEHGENDDDEINIIRAGANYGWPVIHQSGGAERGMIDPVWSSGSVTFATSGGAFATGPAWGAWSGSFFVATLKDTTLRRFVVSGTSVTQAGILYRNAYGRLRAVVLGPDGSLYLTTSNRDGRGSPVQTDDRIVRISPSL